jgi:single-stranded-DNA-specific exonuclease
MVEDLTARLQEAARLLRSFPPSTRVRVVSHYDADGTAAAAILVRMLVREGYDVFATLMRNPFTKDFDRLMTEDDPLLIFSDMGSGQLASIEQLKGRSIILDHHQPGANPPSAKVVQVNTNLCNVDGNYAACGSTLAYLLATTVNPAYANLVPLAIAGAIGDRQHMGGFQGVNHDIVQAALKNGLVAETMGMKLYGGSIADALYWSIDPYFPGLSGNREAITGVLERLKVDGSKPVDALSGDDMARLQSYLVLVCMRHGCAKEVLDLMISPRYRSALFPFDLERLADVVDACGKSGHRGVGLTVCLGGLGSWSEAERIEREYNQRILDALLQLPTRLMELSGLRYFMSDDSSLGGVIAGIAAMYVVPQDKALFALTRKDDELHVSCRGNRVLVERGLDLGKAMREVGGLLGGHGGGHKIAAGATIALSREAEFLEKTDQVLSGQVRR